MGLAMAAGRPFTAADDRPGAPRVVVISYGLWMRAFGGDRSAIGRTIRVSGTPCEVIGVTAQGYRGLSQGGFFPPVDVTLPLAAQPDVMPRWSAMPASGASLFTSNQFWVRAIVRVPAGTNGSEGALASALRGEFAKLPGATPEEIPQVTVRLLPGGRGLDSLRQDTERPLAILGAVVAVVLLMSCANLAGLMLARGVARQRELAVRRALGAGRARLIRVLMTETLLLAMAGGVVGLLVAVWSWPGRRVDGDRRPRRRRRRSGHQLAAGRTDGGRLDRRRGPRRPHPRASVVRPALGRSDDASRSGGRATRHRPRAHRDPDRGIRAVAGGRGTLPSNDLQPLGGRRRLQSRRPRRLQAGARARTRERRARSARGLRQRAGAHAHAPRRDVGLNRRRPAHQRPFVEHGREDRRGKDLR